MNNKILKTLWEDYVDFIEQSTVVGMFLALWLWHYYEEEHFVCIFYFYL